MCQTVKKQSLFLLIVATLTLTISLAQKSQAMPSREMPASQKDELNESTLYVEDVPPIVTNVSKDRIRRDQTNERNERRRHGTTTTTTQRTIFDDGSIRFPEEVGGPHRVYPAPQPNPSCMGKTFCEETASGYPQEFLSNIISRSGGLRQFANVDQIDIGERLDSSDADMLCGSQSKVVFPKLAETEKKEWVFVLQDEKQGYRQGVKIENCNEGTAEGRCQVIDDFVTGYTTSCKQKYVFRVLAAVDKNGTANADPIKMPSSCCCQIKYVGGNVGSRIAAAVKPLKNQTPAVTTKSPRKPGDRTHV